MPQLAREAAIGHLGPGVAVERSGVKGFTHALEHRRRQLVPLGAEQSACGVAEQVDRGSLALRRFPEALRVAAPLE